MMMMMMTMVMMRRREHICTINLQNAIWIAMHAQYIKAPKTYYYYYQISHFSALDGKYAPINQQD